MNALIHFWQLADLVLLTLIHWKTRVLFYPTPETVWTYWNATQEPTR